MMITCPECHVSYRINATKLDPAGQNVRCTKCNHVWFFVPVPEEEGGAAVPPSAPQAAVVPPLPSEPDNAAYHDDVPARVAEGGYDHDDVPPPEDIPPVLTRIAEAATVTETFVDHRPLGLSANQFGVVIFAGLVCLVLSLSLVFKNKIVDSYLPAFGFYHALGVGLDIPGEGTRFSAMTARLVPDGDDTQLIVSAKLANISGEPLDYPSLRITAFDDKGKVLKSWDFHPDKTTLSASETIPVKFAFDTPPGGIATVEIRAIKKNQIRG